MPTIANDCPVGCEEGSAGVSRRRSWCASAMLSSAEARAGARALRDAQNAERAAADAAAAVLTRDLEQRCATWKRHSSGACECWIHGTFAGAEEWA